MLIAALLAVSACGGTETAPPANEPPYVAEGNQTNEPPETQPDNQEPIDWSLYPIIIDGSIGVAANPYFPDGDDFPTHVPLIPIAEALNSAVNWNRDTGEVTLQGLNGSISFVVGDEDYDVDGETVSLWLPSMLVDGELYVPIPFFRNIFGMGSAMWMSGHVYIDTHATDDMH